MDARNTLKQHLIVGVFSLALVLILKSFLDNSWTVSFARVSYFLLFLVLIIGPITRLMRPEESASPIVRPWSWRGELGIWFAVLALVHFIILLIERSFFSLIRIGGSGYGLSNLLGLIALIFAILLSITSIGRVIGHIGIDLWKWLHSFTHAAFYLIAGHFAYFQFFSTRGNGPDWFGYLAVALALIVIVLQLITFFKGISKNKKSETKEVESPTKTSKVSKSSKTRV